jgi:hypothetical protein
MKNDKTIKQRGGYRRYDSCVDHGNAQSPFQPSPWPPKPGIRLESVKLIQDHNAAISQQPGDWHCNRG